MRKSWSMCVLLGALAWGQATPPTQQTTPAPAGNAAAPRAPGPPQAPAAPVDNSAAVPPDAPVLTIKGVCPPAPKTAASKAAAGKEGTPAAKAPAASKTSAADCKTVITKAEFEKIANGLSPNMTPQLKHQLSTVLPRLMAMSQEAEKKGLDKTPRYKELMNFAKMQILTQELQKSITEEASKVPEKDIADYYQKNPEAYEQYNLDRLFVPRMKQPAAEENDKDGDKDKDEKLTEEQQKAKAAEDKEKEQQGEQDMTKLAETLQARAAAGEDFAKLQKEAFEAAGMKIDSPTVNLPKIRRTGLPSGHAAVFDLKPGQVSQVINDSGGHYIYKVVSREQLPLAQVKDEIRTTLQNQRTRDAMDKYQNAFQVETNQNYFGAAGASPMRPGMPPPRGPQRPGMAPSPATPAPQAQPPAQPPAQKPD